MLLLKTTVDRVKSAFFAPPPIRDPRVVTSLARRRARLARRSRLARLTGPLVDPMRAWWSQAEIDVSAWGSVIIVTVTFPLAISAVITSTFPIAGKLTLGCILSLTAAVTLLLVGRYLRNQERIRLYREHQSDVQAKLAEMDQ